MEQDIRGNSSLDHPERKNSPKEVKIEVKIHASAPAKKCQIRHYFPQLKLLIISHGYSQMILVIIIFPTFSHLHTPQKKHLKLKTDYNQVP